MNGDGQLSLAEILERTEAIKHEQEALKEKGELLASRILTSTLPYPHPISLFRFPSHPHSVPNPNSNPPPHPCIISIADLDERHEPSGGVR